MGSLVGKRGWRARKSWSAPPPPPAILLRDEDNLIDDEQVDYPVYTPVTGWLSCIKTEIKTRISGEDSVDSRQIPSKVWSSMLPDYGRHAGTEFLVCLRAAGLLGCLGHTVPSYLP